MNGQYGTSGDIKDISLLGVALYPNLQGILGEKYCAVHRIVVLADTPAEIKVAVPEGSLMIVDEIRKALPRQKRIDLYIGDQLEIEWVFARGYDLYELNHSN